jgi:hypothetical protein
MDREGCTEGRHGGSSHEAAVTLLLCGDVMTGRGIDQVRPGHPRQARRLNAVAGEPSRFSSRSWFSRPLAPAGMSQSTATGVWSSAGHYTQVAASPSFRHGLPESSGQGWPRRTRPCVLDSATPPDRVRGKLWRNDERPGRRAPSRARALDGASLPLAGAFSKSVPERPVAGVQERIRTSRYVVPGQPQHILQRGNKPAGELWRSLTGWSWRLCAPPLLRLDHPQRGAGYPGASRCRFPGCNIVELRGASYGDRSPKVLRSARPARLEETARTCGSYWWVVWRVPFSSRMPVRTFGPGNPACVGGLMAKERAAVWSAKRGIQEQGVL